MCVARGKRCEYADALANVRRKVRSRMRGASRSEVEDQVTEEVRKFCKENPELVKAHLPAKMGFHWTPPKRKVPEGIREMLGDIKDPVKGHADQSQLYGDLAARNRRWIEGLSREEEIALRQYAMTSYESINPYLRRRGFAEWAKKSHYLFDREGGAKRYLEEVMKPRIASMDSAFTRAEKPAEPDRLYRFYRVPTGVTPKEFISRYFQKGSGFKDKGFVSASADPEYVAAHIMDRDGKKNSNYIVLEILTDAGASLHSASEYSGSVQDVEAEVLLPRNTGMRVIETGNRRFEFAKSRPDLKHRFGTFGGRGMKYEEGDSINLPVVRLVDESLIKSEGSHE